MKECCRCGVPVLTSANACNPCHAKRVAAWRKGMHSGPTREFPGVDIDAIHYKRGAVRKAA